MSGTIQDWEDRRKEAEVLEALTSAFHEHVDVLVNRYGDLWAVRPITIQAQEFLSDWAGEIDPSTLCFGTYTLPVERQYIVGLVDELHDAGFVLR